MFVSGCVNDFATVAVCQHTFDARPRIYAYSSTESYT